MFQKTIFLTWVALLSYLLCAQPALARDDDDYVVMVAPSGDLSGVTDADIIEAALNNIKDTGGTVRLRKGHYYVSRGIVILDPDGIKIEGQGKNKTIVEAVRGPGDVGFDFPHVSTFFPRFPGVIENYPSLFWFEGANGLVFKDLTLQVLDEDPADEYFWISRQSTALLALVMDLGGTGDTIFKNVKLKGAPGHWVNPDLPLEAPAKNVDRGIHSQKGTDRFTAGAGNFIGKKMEMENIGIGMFVGARRDAKIIIKENVARDVGLPYLVEGRSIFAIPQIIDSTVDISDNEAYNSFWTEIRVARIVGNSTTLVKDNVLEDGNRFGGIASGILLAMLANATIKGNEVSGLGRAGIFLALVDDRLVKSNSFEMSPNEAAIRVRLSNNVVVEENDYEDSDLPGWTGDPNNGVCNDGPGAVNLSASNDNLIIEEDFPDDTTIETQVCDQGIGNVILENDDGD